MLLYAFTNLGVSQTLYVRRVLFQFGIIKKAFKSANLKIIRNMIYLGLFVETKFQLPLYKTAYGWNCFTIFTPDFSSPTLKQSKISMWRRHNFMSKHFHAKDT